MIDEDALEDGLMFDGSSIEGWKAINESDMILKPDLEAVYDDPFSATPMLVMFCDIVEPSTGEGYARDPRTTAKRAEAYVASTGIGDTVYVGPEAEFFMFDDVRFETGYNKSGFEIDDIELPTNTGRAYEGGNLGHRPARQGRLLPASRPLTVPSTSAPKWSRPCSKWACPATSITMKSPPRSTSWA